MKNIILLFRREALKKAYDAGVRFALADPANVKEIFDAGKKHGSAYLNEAVHSPNFQEFIKLRRMASPGSFLRWLGRNEKKLSTVVDEERFNLVATEKSIELKNGKKLITLDAIEDAITYIMDISIEELRYNACSVNIIKTPRFFAWYLSYHHCHNTLADMGERWGDRHYATVIHGARCIERDANLYPADKQKLTLLYRYLAIEGYDITHFVQDEDVPSRSGHNRMIVKRVDIEI